MSRGRFLRIRRDLLAPQGLDDFERLMRCEEGELIATARTRRTWRLRAGAEVFYLKTQRIPRLLPRYFLRASALAREVRAFDRMRRLGLRTPEVAALGERRRLGFMIESLLVTREVPGSVCLETWAVEGFPPRPGIPPWPALREELFGSVARINARGFRFGDLKWRNILAAPPDRRGSSLVFLDQRRFRRCPERWIGFRSERSDAALLASEEKRLALLSG